MKKVVFVVIILASCRNKKAELVDMEIRLKDSLSRATMVWQQQALDVTLPAKRAVGRDQANAIRVIGFQKTIDSIEMELKRY